MSVTDIDEGMVDTRLRRSDDIRAVFSRGKRVGESRVHAHVLPRGDTSPGRWTVVANRRVGSAVVRNRAKRRLRAIMRACVVPAGIDMVLVARPETASAPSAALAADVQRLVEQASRYTGASR
jgi:ribonuclease P protein component